MVVERKSFGYISEEFWNVHDELMKLLISTIHRARVTGMDEVAQRLESIKQDVEENTPSGYWK
ncbi:MAG: hypothetical protein ACTSU3_01445 [Candidatus Thorarchaeota archaeon]